MRSYIKIYGPPYLKSIRALEEIAVDTPEVCIMNSVLFHADPYTQVIDWIYNYFKNRGDVSYMRCRNIISKSGELLSDYDFFFEWFVEPSKEQIIGLIGRIDDALEPLGALYSITTVKE